MSYEIAVDLHLHTSYSDGVLSPKDLVNLCYKNGLKHISITDHDCIDYKKIKNNAKLIIDTRNVFKKEIKDKIIKL